MWCSASALRPATERVFGRTIQPFRWLPPQSWTATQQSIQYSIRTLCLLFAISCSAWLASAPLSAAYFGYIAPGAILLNMLLVNLAALVICNGVLALACALIGLPALSAFLNHAAWVCIHLMDTLVTCFTVLPGATLPCPRFSSALAVTLLAGYLLAIWIHQFHLKRYSPHGLWLAPVLLLTGLTLCMISCR